MPLDDLIKSINWIDPLVNRISNCDHKHNNEYVKDKPPVSKPFVFIGVNYNRNYCTVHKSGYS